MTKREYAVNVQMTFEYIGVITLRAASQEEADAKALAEFDAYADRAFDMWPARLGLASSRLASSAV